MAYTNRDVYILRAKPREFTAGNKAPDDVAAICARMGMRLLRWPMFPRTKNKLLQKLWLAFHSNFNWVKVFFAAGSGARVVYQHPSYGYRVSAVWVPLLQKRKGLKMIAVIHDLESLRRGIAGAIEDRRVTNTFADNKLLKQFDAVICHNEHMRQYLIGQGFDENKLVNLEIFDYLSDCKRVQPEKGSAPSIAIAGNLSKGKCGYIYEILAPGANPGLTVNLYGGGFDESAASDRFVWHGSFKPEELPDHLTGDFGLVWDGPVAETCGGNTGEYLRYNNPHKTSLYLSSGMPVVVWSEAAIADFVRENGVGITVSSLAELESAIRAVSPEDYARMRENVQRVGAQLRDGHYLRCALAEAEQCF